jgi:PTS system galactitol-specific IIA component
MTPTTMKPIRVEDSLSLVRPHAVSAADVLRAVAEQALEQGFVRETFADALLAREKQFPTGLPTPFPVAIPHTDADHVIRPGLAAVLLDPPVEFGEMGGAERTVAVRLAVVLMVTDPSSQVGLLSRLIMALRRPDLEEALAGPDSPTALADAVQRLLD